MPRTDYWMPSPGGFGVGIVHNKEGGVTITGVK